MLTTTRHDCNERSGLQVEFNKTMSPMEFTKDMARTMGERGNKERESLLMICHGHDSIRQLALHVLIRPHFSLMDVCGTVPEDYFDGELILPIFVPNNKTFTAMAVHQHAKCKTYDQSTYLGELGFFQGVIRVTQAYDESTKDIIAGEYARCTHQYYSCPEEIVKTAILWTVDSLRPKG